MKRILASIVMALSVTAFAAEQRPNILFIAIDDMNDWTGFLGGHPQAQTPNMDRLAEKGVNFSNAHCSAPGCSPSRNALLYGVEPFNSGLYAYEFFIKKVLNSFLPWVYKRLRYAKGVSMRTEAIKRADIDGAAAGTRESVGGDVADFSTADGLMGALICGSSGKKSWKGSRTRERLRM